jgi:subtilisin family serine protease
MFTPPARMNAWLGSLTAVVFAAWLLSEAQAQNADFRLPPDEKSVQLNEPQGHAALVEASQFIRAVEARAQFNVTGAGLTAAVFDTGLRASHVDFGGNGRVPAQRNFTDDNGGNDSDAADGDGHGTNVAGIIAAHADHTGIAPGANIVPLKVLSNTGSGSFDWMNDAFQWVIDHRQEFNISVVNVSISDSQNFQSDSVSGLRAQIRDKIAALRQARVPVVISAGNDFFNHSSAQGMAFPAICRETVSVGAIYDTQIPGGFTYQSGAVAHSIAAGAITPFSQRLHETAAGATPACRTDIFATGAPLTSSGINNDHGESIQHGTSQAAPTTAGVILLLQELHQRVAGELPLVDDIERWVREGGVVMKDGDDENDNVVNTDLQFVRVDALGALKAEQRDFTSRLFRDRAPLRKR